MSKTKKEFLNDYCTCPELAKKVFNQIGVQWSMVRDNAIDYRNAESGVCGFTYHSDTRPFAKRNILLILTALDIFEDEIGEPLNKPFDSESKYNWYAWFALEHVIDQVMSYTEY